MARCWTTWRGSRVRARARARRALPPPLAHGRGHLARFRCATSPACPRLPPSADIDSGSDFEDLEDGGGPSAGPDVDDESMQSFEGHGGARPGRPPTTMPPPPAAATHPPPPPRRCARPSCGAADQRRRALRPRAPPACRPALPPPLLSGRAPPPPLLPAGRRSPPPGSRRPPAHLGRASPSLRRRRAGGGLEPGARGPGGQRRAGRPRLPLAGARRRPRPPARALRGCTRTAAHAARCMPRARALLHPARARSHTHTFAGKPTAGPGHPARPTPT